jgi:hypothetical protein
LNPSITLGINLDTFINQNIYNNIFLCSLTIFLPLIFVLIYYYDSNGPLKVGLILLSLNNLNKKIIPLNQFYLFTSLYLRIFIGLLFFYCIKIFSGTIALEDFGFQYLFELLSCQLLISAISNIRVFSRRSFVGIIGLFLIVPLFFTIFIEIVQRINFGLLKGQELRSLVVWFIILISTLMPILKRKNEGL